MKKKKGSWVMYLLTDGDNNYKVGIAKNPDKRIRTFNTANPKNLKMLLVSYCGTFENAITAEKKLHKLLYKKRKEREWFELTEIDLVGIGYYFINVATKYIKEVPSIKKTSDKEKRKQVLISDVQLIEEAKKIFLFERRASASLLQTRLSIGYARASRIISQLEKEGFVGEHNGSSPREVLALREKRKGIRIYEE